MNDLYGDLNKNTTRLVTALRDPGTAGNWGELALQRVLEIAGLAEHVDYETQVHIPGEDKNSRPDVIVTLPGERRIVIDAKTPLDAYLQAMEVNDEQQRRALLVTFAEKVMGHGKALAKRDYGKSVEGLELVGLFLPSESAYRAALDVRPNLVEDMLALNIMLISPQNSYAHLAAKLIRVPKGRSFWLEARSPRQRSEGGAQRRQPALRFDPGSHWPLP